MLALLFSLAGATTHSVNEQPVQNCQEQLEGMSLIFHNASLLIMLLMMQPKRLAGAVVAARPLGMPSYPLLLPP